MMFWIVLLALCVASAAPIILAWRRADGARLSELGHDKAMYEARLAEVDADYELGRIDDHAREAAIAEESRRYLRLSEASPGSSPTKSRSMLAVAIIIMGLSIPVLSLSVYFSLGNPQIGVASIDPPTDVAQPTLEELVAVAEKRLETNPDDVRGWQVLAPVYIRMGRLEDAEKAYRNLLRLNEGEAETKQALAELLVIQNEGRVGDEAFALFSQIANDKPGYARADYFLGLAARQNGDLERARTIWMTMLENATGDEPWVVTVREQLSELETGTDELSAIDEDQMQQINDMVNGLAARLNEQPGTKQDWERLIRSYTVLGKLSEAQSAFDRASELFKDEPEFLASLAKLLPPGESENKQP